MILNCLKIGEVYQVWEHYSVIKSLNLLNKQSNWYLGEVEGYKDERGTSPKWGFLDIEYKNGVIQNQKIFFESDYYYNKIIDENGVIDYTGYYKPWVQFENGKVTKTLTQNDEYHLPEFKIINNNVTTVYSYTLTPKCWNAFSFLNEDDRKKNKEKPFVDFGNKFWNKKQLFMEVYNMDNRNLEINSLYKLYYGFKYAPYQTELFKDITDQNIQDTVGCKIAAYYKYENGKRNGVARIFEGNGSVAYKISFKDDLLHGESSHYYNDGKTAFNVNFNNGLPEGEAVSYINPNSKVPLLSVSGGRAEHLKGGLFLPQSIIKWNEEKNIQLMIQTIKDNGGKISQIDSYQPISKVNYIIDSIQLKNGYWERYSYPQSNYSILNNEKPMRTFKIDYNSNYKNKIIDWDYIDQDGKVVYTKAKEDQANIEKSKKETQERNKKNEEYNNSLQKCVWCSKELAYKNGIASNNTIPCHESNGEKHSIGGVYTLFYCSNACKANYEENQCRKKGYYYGYRKK